MLQRTSPEGSTSHNVVMHAYVFKEQEKNAALRETHIPAVEWVKNVFTRCSLSMGTPCRPPGRSKEFELGWYGTNGKGSVNLKLLKL